MFDWFMLLLVACFDEFTSEEARTESVPQLMTVKDGSQNTPTLPRP